ncbi:flagellar protein FlgN [Scandinavium sp. NPDC088450]|uniref:flagellar protein FlgN n=1 Tax=Scandinavium sp. NPDC088450 TaxID=3364514 RepID=UPI00384AE17C
MSNASESVKTLIQDMVADRNLYTLLRDRLEAQREGIILRDVAVLEMVNQEIITLYQQLSAHSQKRHRLLKALGIPVGVKGLKMLFSRLPENWQNQVKQLWADLEDNAATCKMANDANGMLLNMQNDILQNLLNVSEPENWLYQQV